MINLKLALSVDSLDSVLLVFDRIRIRRYTGTGIPDTAITDAVALTDYATISGGIDVVSKRENVSDVVLLSGYTQYDYTDPAGKSNNWYISSYYHTDTGATSSWSDPIRGEIGKICWADIYYPVEVAYGTSDQLIIDRIRRLVGDPVRLKREYNECDNIHEGGKVYELSEKGWPCSINIENTMYNTTYNDLSNPAVNGYRYLEFSEDITTHSGSGEDLKVNIFYYTFRHSDREIYEAYKYCTPPQGLTKTTANSEAYMLQIAIDLLMQELWEDSTEDGAIIKDETSHYDPEGGQKIRSELIDKLQKRLDYLVRPLILSGISGVLID